MARTIQPAFLEAERQIAASTPHADPVTLSRWKGPLDNERSTLLFFLRYLEAVSGRRTLRLVERVAEQQQGKGKMMQTVGDDIESRGFRRGMRRGLKAGLEKGLEKGREEGVRKGVRRRCVKSSDSSSRSASSA
ncbi:MAG: hypothetical protein Q8L48_12180 [Archangium sp.]|nr:hypothetical protein [Archangium sp.]